MLPGIEYIKTLLNGIMSRLRRVEKDVAETKTKAVNSDWNVHDTGDGAHVKNRPFYNDYVESMLLYRVNDPPTSGQGAAYLGIFESAFIVGKTYRVTLEGAGVNNGTYECKCIRGDGNNGTLVGRLYLLKSVGSDAINDGSIFQNPDTLEVFAWSWWDDAKYTLTIEGPGYELKPIDPKYLSGIDSDFLGDKAVTSIDGKTGALSANDIAVAPVTVKRLVTYSAEGISQRVCYENASAVYLGNEVFLTTSDYVGYGKNRAIFPCRNVASKTSNAYFAHRMPDSQNCSALCLTNVGYVKSYAVPIPPTASIGQAISVKAVDKNGKPTEWEAMNIPEQVQSDWNQNDSTAADYVKNRTHYDASWNLDTTHILGSYDFNSGFGFGRVSDSPIDIPNPVKVSYQGNVYTSSINIWPSFNADEFYIKTSDGRCTIAMVIRQENTSIDVYKNDTIYRINNPSIGTYVLYDPMSYRSIVSLYTEDIHTLDEKFIPDTIARVADIPTVDSTLTKAGQAADAAVVGNRLSTLSEEKVSLPKAEDGTVIPGTAGWYAVSDGAGGITWVESAPSTGGGGETTHGIVWDLTNVTSSNNAISVADGASLVAVLTPVDGYTLGTPTITMGGTDITNTAWDADTATVTIASVTGDVVITCTGTAQSSGVVDTSPIIAETGYGLSSSGSTVANTYLCYTEIYSLGTTLTGGKTRAIKYYIAQSATDGSSGGNNKQCVYLDGSFVNYYTTAFNKESRANYSSAKGDINQVRFTLCISSVDDSWAYFEDTGEIIFAGKNTQYYGMSNIDGTMAGGGSGTTSASTLSVDDDYAQDYRVSTLSLVTGESASVAAETGLDAGFAAAIEQAKNAWMLESNGSVDKIPLIIHTDYHGRFSQPLWETISQMVDWYELSRVVNLGDVVDSWADADTDNPLTKCTGLENYLKSMESVPFSKRIEIFGNHDTWKLENSAYTGLTPQNYLRKYFKNIYARGKDNYGNMVVYDDRYNVKYLIISGMAYDAGIGGYSHYVIPTASWDWIIDQLEKADGYDVVVLSHVALGRNGETVINPTGETAEESVGCVDWVARTDFWAARKNKTSGSFSDQYGVSHSYDFSGCDGELLCGLHGHEHSDGYYYIGNSLLDVFFDAYYISPNAIHFVLIDRENRRLNVWKVDNTPQVQNYQIPMDQPTT